MIHCLLVEVENSFSLLHVKAGAIHLKDRNQATGVKLFVPGSSFHIERMIALKARPYKASDHIKLGAREALQIFDIFLHHMRCPQHLNDKKFENIVWSFGQWPIRESSLSDHLVERWSNTACRVGFIARRCFSDRYFQTLLRLWGEKLPFLAAPGYTGEIW